ncbi:hypothetical protein [Bdellovibrio sp. HCB288]|uniref:hypothetical protein n=1 Tax=Bdellovibrio sp. HCB288 TaxID=3394355 RepID=UPI0039B3A85E
MKRKYETKRNRFDTLTEAINLEFGNQTQAELHHKALAFPHYQMDMYHVSRVLKNQIELVHEFNDEIIYPVFVDEKIRQHLKKGDTFLLGLGLREFDWHILWMSPPYHVGEWH